MAEFFRGAAPPPSQTKVEVIRVKGTDTQTFFVLSRQIFGVEIHWLLGRSVECTKSKGGCKGCEGAAPSKWKGYLHVVPGFDREKTVFLELTPAAVERLSLLAAGLQDLRGLILQIGKSRGGARGRYVVQVQERRIPDAELPAESDPYPTLQFLWNCKKAK
jgi:hypothetical protein